MKNKINLHLIVEDSLNTMPILNGDTSFTSNYAQRILTKSISDRRKSGIDISDNESQELRKCLDALLDNYKHSSIQPITTEEIKEIVPKISKKPDLEMLFSTISSCFHTSTDGSASHLDYLKQKANREALIYLQNFDLSWLEKRRMKREVSKIITENIDSIKNNGLI